jgi:hypothetical protein
MRSDEEGLADFLAETKEQLGGIQILEARPQSRRSSCFQLPALRIDLDQLRYGRADLSEIIRESQQRRRNDTAW